MVRPRTPCILACSEKQLAMSWEAMQVTMGMNAGQMGAHHNSRCHAAVNQQRAHPAGCWQYTPSFTVMQTSRGGGLVAGVSVCAVTNMLCQSASVHVERDAGLRAVMDPSSRLTSAAA
jgi:hypothetical protein